MAHYAPPGGLRDQAKNRIRDRIVSVSLRLFAQRGYDLVTTQEIADAAEITQRTLFRYFARKDIILFQDDHDYVAHFERCLSKALKTYDVPFDAMFSAYLSLADFFDRNRTDLGLIHSVIQGSETLRMIEQRRQQKIDLIAAHAMDGNEAFELRANTPSLRSRIVAGVFMGAIRPVQRAWIRGELTGSLVSYIENSRAGLIQLHEAAIRYGEIFTPVIDD